MTLTAFTDHNNAAILWQNTRTANRPRHMLQWVQQAHPGAADTLKAEHTPTGYLKDLYPNIWVWGPRGDIYATQLDIIENRLDAIKNGAAYHDFIDDLSDTYQHLHIYNHKAVYEPLIWHAKTTGLPLPGGDIFGYLDDIDRVHTRILNHPILTGAGGYREDHARFQNAVYKFSLTSIHQVTLTYLTHIIPELTEAQEIYNTFCDRWEIPR